MQLGIVEGHIKADRSSIGTGFDERSKLVLRLPRKLFARRAVARPSLGRGEYRQCKSHPTTEKRFHGFLDCAGPLSLLRLLPDSRIRQRVKEIGQEVHGYVCKTDHEDAALAQVVVAATDGADGQEAYAGPGETCFRN